MKKIEVKAILTESEQDLTGRDRMFSNVLWSWGGYIIILVSGFIMPRMIDSYIGQFSLGIWDFCWSIVNYLSLSSFGIGASVNRYVAKYRAIGNIDALCSSVSSVMFIELIISIGVVIFSTILAWCIPLWFSSRLGSETDAAQWVVACLGISIAVQMALGVSRGIITGCHRWDINNGINVISSTVAFSLMLAVLLMGEGLRALGISYLLSVLVCESLRMYMAFRICPEIKIEISMVKWPVAKEMLLFGGKVAIATISPFILVQTVNLLIIDALGAAMLAVFSRPVALVRHIETFMNKFAFITTPTAGAMQESTDAIDLKNYLLDTTKYAAAVVFPITVFLVVFGDVILRIWMGPRYEYGLVLSVLAIGYVLPTSQSPVLRILIGMDLHGKIGAISLLASMGVLFLGSVFLYFTGWDLVLGAILLSSSLTAGIGVLIPAYACYIFKISPSEYFTHAFLVPTMCSIVLAVILFLIRVLFINNVYAAFGCGIAMSVLLMSTLYWRYIIPEEYQIRVRQAVFNHKS